MNIVFRSRIMLCDYYLQQADMIGIYEQYAYLRAYQQKHPDVELCSEYIPELKTAYDTLVILDKQKEIQEGLYFSNVFNKNGLPVLAFEIRRTGNTYSAIIHPVCEFAKMMDMYKENGMPSYKTNAQSEILYESEQDNELYIAMWGTERKHYGNEKAAKTWMEGGEKFRSNMYGEMAKRDMSLGETVGATVGTELGGIMFDVISNLFASQKITARSLGIKWNTESPGVLKACIDFYLETQKSGNSPQRKEVQYYMRMYKMYPHYELLFRNTNGLYLTYKDEKNNKKIEKTNIIFFDNDLKRYWYDSSKHNLTMYKHFATNTIFKSYIEKYRTHLHVPAMDDLRINCNANSGLFYLAGWNKKLKCNDFIAATLQDDGSITIGEMVNGRYNGILQQYNKDGSYNDLAMVNGHMNGRCILRRSNGKVYFDGNYSYGKREGYGVETLLDGTVYKGMWENGKKNGEGSIIYPDNRSFSGEFNENIPRKGTGTLKKDSCFFTGTLLDGQFVGDCIIEYANGDVYKGYVEEDRPNGLGTMTYADVNMKPHILKTKWTDGIPERNTQKSSIRKKKGSRR